MNYKMNKDLLFKYFAGMATPSQEGYIGDWFQSGQQNQELFFLWLEQWEIENAEHSFDTKADFKRLRARITRDERRSSEKKMPHRTGIKSFFRSWQISAAVAALLIVSATIYLFGERSPQNTYLTEYGEMRSITLPDGSTVRLNGNSSLKVVEGLEGVGPREVWLDGEAFFTVIHTADDRRFIVHTGDVRVEVLGTEFNVKDRNETTQVVLNSGKVRLNLDGGGPPSEDIVMAPGDMVEYTDRTQVFTKKRVNTRLHTSWRNGEFVFERTPLRDIVKMLEQNYGLKVMVEDISLKDQEFTATLPADNMEVLLKALAKSFDLEVKQEEGLVTLTRGQ